MKKSKFLALCLSLVCAFVLAGVLATTALADPVTYYVGSADFDYQGDTHTPDYATVEAALTAMGTNGGTIIFTGSHNYLDTHLAKVNNAPYVTFIGADSTATLVISNKSYYHRTQATYQHLTLQLPNNGGVYFLAGDGSNRSITIGSIDPATGLGANDVTVTGTTQQFYLAGNAGWGAAEDVTINSGRYDYVGATYGNASAGSNSHVTINGGTMPNKIVAGMVKVGTAASAATIQGNVTLTLNGGTYNATQYITVNENSAHTTTVNGKTTVIINNGLADTYNFVTTELDYTIKSTADGFVELAAEGSADTAPTFTITADDATNVVYVNGTPIATTAGVASFTPEAAGTYNITYGAAPTATLYSLTFNANGGSGSQAGVSAEEGESVALPTTSNFTNPGKYFVGWGATADATIPVATPYYMPATDTVLYAIWYDAVYVNPDGSGTLTVGGTTYAAAYTSVADALTALGSTGGTIIFTGSHNYLDTHLAKVNNAPYVTFIGADSTATLILSNKSYYHRTQATYQNLTLQLPNSSGVYFMAGDGSNRSITIGSIDPATGLGANDVTVTGTTQQFYLTGNAGWGAAEDLVINSGRYDYIGATYGNASAGSNSHITINGGTMPSKIVAGMVKVGTTASAATIQGNVTLTLNGGTYNATQYITVNENNVHTTTVNGKVSVIINNDLASTYNFVTTDIDYVLKSTADGFVELTTEGSADTAPTFTITANDPTDPIYVNGTEIASTAGVATFTPDANGVYEITYGAPAPAIVAFTDAKADGAGYVADTADAAEKTYAIIASVQISDDIDVADITGFGFYGYVADTDTVVVNQTTATIIGTLTANNKKYYTLIYDIPTIDTEVVLKPFVTAAGTTYTGTATSYVPSTIGADTYYGPESAILSYFAY